MKMSKLSLIKSMEIKQLKIGPRNYTFQITVKSRVLMYGTNFFAKRSL